jgi:hypothetical protein
VDNAIFASKTFENRQPACTARRVILASLALGRLAAVVLSLAVAVQGAADPAATIVGHVWGGDGRPVANATLRLRNAATGEIAGRTVSADAGQFTFVEAAAGTYVVECVDDLGKVLGVGNTFEVKPGDTLSTFVRLNSERSRVGNFFTSIAAAVISSAASVGVTAVGSTGRPTSPNR